MTHFVRSSLLLGLTASATFVGVGVFGSPTQSTNLDALPRTLFQDSDNDMLPDSLEWVLMMDPNNPDSDGDGVDDFLEAAQMQLPGATPPPMDHEMRAVVSYLTLPDQTDHVMLNLLFRVVSGGEQEVKSIQPFIDIQGSRVSISSLFASGIVHLQAKVDPVEGLYVLVTSRLALNSEVAFIMPCSIGVAGRIGQRTFSNGSLLAEIDNTITTVAPISPTQFVFQPIDAALGPQGPQSPQHTFWASSQVCVLELEQQGGGGPAGSVLCRVRDSHCSGAPTLLCAPSCPTETGNVYVVPDGLGFLNGQ